MPYIKQKARDVTLEQGLNDLHYWLQSVPVLDRKGILAYIVMYLGKYTFGLNYFGRSTGLDAVRSALRELETDLDVYETDKRAENGDV